MDFTPLITETQYIRAISLGAGVQSTTLLLMAERGEIEPLPDVAIFADTQWEPRRVYRHLEWLRAIVTRIPIVTITVGNLREHTIRKTTTGHRSASVPWFIRNPDGSKGRGRRQCTREYKIDPILRRMRVLVGPSRKAKAELWIGISTDEAHRMKPARRQWITHRWPLIDRSMSRADCLAWIEKHGYPAPPKSSCIGCPFHNNALWRDMRDKDPAEWADAVAVDRIIRSQPGFRGQQFMHRSLVPLDQVDLGERAGQADSFGEECEGMCGV